MNAASVDELLLPPLTIFLAPAENLAAALRCVDKWHHGDAQNRGGERQSTDFFTARPMACAVGQGGNQPPLGPSPFGSIHRSLCGRLQRQRIIIAAGRPGLPRAASLYRGAISRPRLFLLCAGPGTESPGRIQGGIRRRAAGDRRPFSEFGNGAAPIALSPSFHALRVA